MPRVQPPPGTRYDQWERASVRAAIVHTRARLDELHEAMRAAERDLDHLEGRLAYLDEREAARR